MPPQKLPELDDSAVAAELKRLSEATSGEPNINNESVPHFLLTPRIKRTRIDRDRDSLRERIINPSNDGDGLICEGLPPNNSQTRRAPTLDELDRM